MCVPGTQMGSTLKVKNISKADQQGTSKHVQPDWFAATEKQDENKYSERYFLQLFVTTTLQNSAALAPEFNLEFNGREAPQWEWEDDLFQEMHEFF